VDLFTQDTDWWVLILRWLPELGPDTGIVTGTKETRRRIGLKPIHDILGPERAAALPGLHSITGCDTTGPISGIGKKKAMKAFMKAPSHIVQALSELSTGDQPARHIIENCEEFYCLLLSSKEVTGSNAATL